MRYVALRQHEAAFLLGWSENDVRNALRRGALAPLFVGRLRRVDANEVLERLVGDDDALALEFFAAVVSGHIKRVPRAQHPFLPAPHQLRFLELLP
ncbi:MAG: hypothetical protein JWL77_6962 [Chthonomonadaceae bacterium]|nr:hypothetical protein [Chthonomonadaceae bacterium]